MIDVQPCEFCGKSQDQVKRLIVASYSGGPLRTICSECVILHMQVLASTSPADRDELVALLQGIEETTGFLPPRPEP